MFEFFSNKQINEVDRAGQKKRRHEGIKAIKEKSLAISTASSDAPKRKQAMMGWKLSIIF
jgi:hypothetical protein